MSEMFLLSRAQVVRVAPHFPRSRGKPRVHDGRLIWGIVYATCNGLVGTSAPRVEGPD
jgi:hypothetical protein